MANRSLHWSGATPTTIDAFDFNIASNWKQYSYLNGRYQFVTASYAPSNSDNIFFGDRNGIIAISPCLFGGYSGGSSGGTACWLNGLDATGTTFNSALQSVSIGDWQNNSGNYGNYPFPYFGTGITGDVLSWVNTTYQGVMSQDGITLSRTMSPLNLKTANINVYGIGVADSLIKFTTTKNFAVPYNAGTGSTASYFVQTSISFNNREKRSGDVVINGGCYNQINISQYTTSSDHNFSSQTYTIIGATIGTVYQYGSNNLYFDENCRIGNIWNDSGWWNGPTYFSGKLDTISINNELFVGLSGGTGGTAGTEDSAIMIKPLTYYNTLGIRGLGTSTTAPYNTPTNIGSDMCPIFYFGNPEATISTAKQITVNSSVEATVGANSGARWAVKFGGQAYINLISASDSRIAVAGNSVVEGINTATSDPIQMPLDKNITIQTVSLAKGSILDLASYPDYDGWKFGSITNGILSGGVVFKDETASIKGSKNMNFVNDNTVEGAKWSSRFNNVVADLEIL